MKNLIRILFVLFALSFYSCSLVRHGTKSKVTFNGDNCKEPVTLTIIGKQGVQKFTDVTFPYTVRIKHKNLPLTACAESDNYIYKDINVERKLADDTWYVCEKWFGGITMAVGAGLGIAVGASCGTDNGAGGIIAGTAFAAAGALIYGHGCLNKVYLPEEKEYTFSMMGQKSDNTNYRSAANMTYDKFLEIYGKSGRISSDSYYYILCKNYKQARKSLDKDIESKDNTTARYFRGICNMNLEHYSKAVDDLRAAKLSYSYDDGFKKEIEDMYSYALHGYHQKLEEKASMWEGIGEFSKLAGAATRTTINSIHGAGGSASGNINSGSTTSDSPVEDDSSDSPSKARRRCSYCKNGRIVVTLNPNTYGQSQNQYNVVCDECGGTFRVNTHTHKDCPHCGGTGYAK